MSVDTDTREENGTFIVLTRPDKMSKFQFECLAVKEKGGMDEEETQNEKGTVLQFDVFEQSIFLLYSYIPTKGDITPKQIPLAQTVS